ncbi:MAG: hypothetical protein JWL60_466 [Gemmatimonadetes bacterium]|jgi:hypothetical protein|nr:hypothetical protein [Gemmatimonadota bacterium]
MILILLSFAITTVVAIVAYAQARAFVTRRLRYVDAVQKPFAPWLAGIGAAVVAMPLVALIPLLGIGTALSFGFAIGAGVAAGAREVRGSLPRW